MASSLSNPLRRLWTIGASGNDSDGELLDRFLSGQGETREAAFEALVTRHGPMVLRVCRSVLRDAHDAEDAFQAVFLVLAGRAGSVRNRASIASWLYSVAHRVSSRSRQRTAKRRAIDRQASNHTLECVDFQSDQVDSASRRRPSEADWLAPGSGSEAD